MKTILKKIRNGETLTNEEMFMLTRALDNSICKKHSGKMAGMQSVSTSVCLNKRCQKNAAVPGSVCEHCYAATMLEIYKALNEKLAVNTELYTSVVLPVDCLPTILNLYFRFEAFGDLNNAIQVVNYFNICKKNPGVHFALWTKSPDIIDKAIKDYQIEKPANLNIIYSSLFLNQVNEKTAAKYPFIDKIFTVYDKETIKRDGIDINCGGLHCASCLKCYQKNEIRHISEKLK